MVNGLETEEGEEYYGPEGHPGEKDPVEVLTSQLPPYYRKDDESNNYRLMSGAAPFIGNMDDDIEDVDTANTVQTAETIPSLERLAKLVNVSYRQGENIENFRTRIMMEFKLLNAEGKINDLIDTSADLLGVKKTAIGYSEDYTTETGCCLLTVPSNALDEFPFEAQEFASIVSDGIPVSYRVDILKPGGYTHTSVTNYQAGGSDPEKAHGGLDVDGNVRDDIGGEYAGLIFVEDSGGTI